MPSKRRRLFYRARCSTVYWPSSTAISDQCSARTRGRVGYASHRSRCLIAPGSLRWRILRPSQGVPYHDSQGHESNHKRRTREQYDANAICLSPILCASEERRAARLVDAVEVLQAKSDGVEVLHVVAPRLYVVAVGRPEVIVGGLHCVLSEDAEGSAIWCRSRCYCVFEELLCRSAISSESVQSGTPLTTKKPVMQRLSQSHDPRADVIYGLVKHIRVHSSRRRPHPPECLSAYGEVCGKSALQM